MLTIIGSITVHEQSIICNKMALDCNKDYHYFCKQLSLFAANQIDKKKNNNK